MVETLKELKSISTRLNESSDSLTSTLTQINDKLNEFNLGVSVWLERPPLTSKQIEPPKRLRHDHGADKVELLGYTKFKGEWCLAVKEVLRIHGYFEGDESCPYTDEIEGDSRPLLNCSREIRVRSIELFPRLFEALKEEAERVIKNVEEAKKIASEL